MNRFEKVSYEQYRNDRAVITGDEKAEADIRSEYDNIKLPARGTKLSAGYDIFAPFSFVLQPGESITFPTGIRVFLDPDKFLAIYPRSGQGFKYKLQLFNTVGIIDADYVNSENEGHIAMKLYNDSPDGKTLSVEAGQGIAQGIIQQYFLTNDDAADGERNGGFGSTDRQ